MGKAEIESRRYGQFGEGVVSEICLQCPHDLPRGDAAREDDGGGGELW